MGVVREGFLEEVTLQLRAEEKNKEPSNQEPWQERSRRRDQLERKPRSRKELGSFEK